MTVCPDCLREEFAQAPAASAGGVARGSIKYDNELSFRRAAARAERLSGGFQSGAVLTPYCGLRFVLGVVIFLACALLFAAISGLEEWQVRSYLPEAAQRPVSILLCWVAAGLVFSSFRQNKLLIYPIVAFFLVGGWFMPDFWSGFSKSAQKDAAAAAATQVRYEGKRPDGAADSKPATPSRVLTEEDLAAYREKKRMEGNIVNYGIYINTPDMAQRQSIRKALARLLEAQSCVPYNRARGSLFIVSHCAGGSRNISHLVSRFGTLHHHSLYEGLYEVEFKPEKAGATNTFPAEALTAPSHESFVAANLVELRNLLDPERVRAAALRLAEANVEQGREGVHRALIEVLRDPWEVEPGTYSALMDALVVYAVPGDRETVDASRKYFLSVRRNKQVPARGVMDLLIREVPAEMVSPVVELWCAQPLEWNDMLSQLGTRTQDLLLEVLATTGSLQLTGAILKHLEQNGTPEAAAAVKPYLDHPDSLISRAARTTLQALGVPTP